LRQPPEKVISLSRLRANFYTFVKFFMQKLGGNSKTPPAAIAFIVRLSEFLRELKNKAEETYDD